MSWGGGPPAPQPSAETLRVAKPAGGDPSPRQTAGSGALPPPPSWLIIGDRLREGERGGRLLVWFNCLNCGLFRRERGSPGRGTADAAGRRARSPPAPGLGGAAWVAAAPVPTPV